MEIIIHDKIFVPYLSAGEIAVRVKEMAQQINRDYEGKRPLFIAILNGAFLFAADLLRHIDDPCAEISFIKLASYEGMNSSGSVTTVIGLNNPLKNRHVIILEDIIDTGKTFHEFLPQLHAHQPASLKIATLLSKPEALQYPIHADYIGFELPNKFVVGYGLDYAGQGRGLPGIYQLKE